MGSSNPGLVVLCSVRKHSEQALGCKSVSSTHQSVPASRCLPCLRSLPTPLNDKVQYGNVRRPSPLAQLALKLWCFIRSIEIQRHNLHFKIMLMSSTVLCSYSIILQCTASPVGGSFGCFYVSLQSTKSVEIVLIQSY